MSVFSFPHTIYSKQVNVMAVAFHRHDKLIKFTPPAVSASANYDYVHFVDIKVNGDGGVYSLFFFKYRAF